MKFATPDQFRSTSGIIGITWLCSLAAVIILCDLFNLAVYLFSEKNQGRVARGARQAIYKKNIRLKPVYVTRKNNEKL